MIDLIKGKLIHKDKIELKLLSDRSKYVVEGKYNYSDKTHRYPLKTRLENLFINVTEKGATIQNSLHKYFNNLVSGENQNFNDFYFCDILYALDVLEYEMDYSLDETVLTNLEFGFNIDLDICPSRFLDNNVLMHDTKSPCYDPKNDKNMKIKKFIYTEYEIKIYNKTLDQSRYKEFKQQLKGTKILRIEIKYKSKKQINKLGVFSLADLRNPEIYNNLMTDFLSKYDPLLIIDSYNGNSLMSKKEREFITNCTHPNYWIALKEFKHSNTILNHKNKLKKLIKKYSLDSWKKNLKKDILNKFQQLINLDCYSSNNNLLNTA